MSEATPPTGVTTLTDEQYQAWLRGHLARAAGHFGLTVTGPPLLGWALRSISAPATGPAGASWLRVGVERDADIAAMPEFWTGNVDANAITGVAKPRVLDSTEWAEPDLARRVRADLLTLLPGLPCCPAEIVRSPLDLPDVWWDRLRADLDALRATPTTRFADHGQVGSLCRAVLGVDVPVRHWETVHGDLHWNNLLAPQFGILDWEYWGSGPAGTDPAALYCRALAVPEVAGRVHQVFGDLLDSPTGRVAQLHVAAGLLGRIDHGEFPELAAPLRRHVHRLLAHDPVTRPG